MKSTLLLFSFLLVGPAFADVNVEIENTNYKCQKKSDSLYHCNEGNKRILVMKNVMGYTAVQKDGDDFPAMKWISKVTEGDKVLFEIPKMNLTGFTSFKTPESTSGRLVTANALMSNLKGLDDDLARQILDESQKFIEKETAAKPKLKILADDKKLDCVRGEDRPLTKEEIKSEKEYNIKIQCNFYACRDELGERILGYIPSSGGFASPYFLNLKGIQTEIRYDGMKILEPGKEGAPPLYDIPKFDRTGYTGLSTLDENLFIPSKFENNKSSFNYFTNPMTSPMREGVEGLCTGDNEVSKLIAEERKTAEAFQEGLINAELGHYLTLVNGQVVSVFVDAAKSKDLGCRYDGMILSKDAQKHIDYLQKAKPRPIDKFITEEEVQDLFQKARNMSDIPFGYKYDGCYARAHVMARRFEAMGIPVEKVWIKGSLFVPGTDVQWNYHVAPVINVKTKNGEIKKYVIDPSLNEKAVTVDGWVESMGKKVKGGVMQTPYPFPVNAANFQRTAVAFSSSDIYVPDNDEVRSEEQNMAMAVQTMKEYTEALKEKKSNENEYENENQHVRPDAI